MIPPRLMAMAAALTAPPVVADRSPAVAVLPEAWVHYQNGESTPAASAIHAVSAAVQGGGAALAAADRPIPVERI
jgi:hypothetical protein